MFYQKLIENSPGFLRAYEQKASLLMKFDKYKDAIFVLGSMLKLNPDFYKAYYDIALCFEKMGKYSDAARYYRKFLTLKPFSQKSEIIRNKLKKFVKRNSKQNSLKICK